MYKINIVNDKLTKLRNDVIKTRTQKILDSQKTILELIKGLNGRNEDGKSK